MFDKQPKFDEDCELRSLCKEEPCFCKLVYEEAPDGEIVEAVKSVIKKKYETNQEQE